MGLSRRDDFAMKPVAGKGIFAAPGMAAPAAAVIFAVPLMLWYQSSCDDKGTDNGISRHNYNQFYNVLAEMALSPEHPECDEALLLCVDNLKRHDYHTAVLTWLRYGAERGSSPAVMLAYADELGPGDPAAAEWRKRAGRLRTGKSAEAAR